MCRRKDRCDLKKIITSEANPQTAFQRLDMRVYLDNCCYNRPYDDQSQLRISLETQAKLHIQNLIKNGELELVSSYMLFFENSRNRSATKSKAIKQFIENNSVVYIDETYSEEIEKLAKTIRSTGVKSADAIHTACAILAKCDYLLTTDDRLLKYQNDCISIINPTEFIRLIGGAGNE